MNLRNYLLPVLLMGVAGNVLAQTLQVPKIYKPVKKEIYHKGWIDFNKNGVKDVYEDPSAPIDARIDDLLGNGNKASGKTASEPLTNI